MSHKLYAKIIGGIANHYIDRKPLLNFLHLGKTAGTVVLESGIGFRQLKSSEGFRLRDKVLWKYRTTVIGHEKVPSSLSKRNLAFFIRDPISRFESAFWYEKNWKSSDYARIIAQPTLTADYYKLFSSFTEWATALIDAEHVKHVSALKLKTLGYHLARDYSFYFRNEKNVISIKKNITFIGETENFKSDILRLCGIIGIKDPTPLLVRRNVSIKPEKDKLSPELRSRLELFFQQEYSIYNQLKGLKL